MKKYIWYALGEIMLVMVGILLALQVNNWNEARKDRAKEQAIILELNRDFKSNAEQLAYISSGHEESLNSVIWLVEHFPDYDKDRDSLAYHLNLMHSAYTFDPSQSAVQALINTSSFDLISNEELRRKLITWSDLFRDYSEEEFVARDVFMQIVIPYMTKNTDMDFLRKADPDVIEDITPFQRTEFKNVLINRQVTLSLNIVNNPEKELERLKQVIQDIIELTEAE